MVAVNIRDSAVLRVAEGVASVRLPRLGRQIEAVAQNNCNVDTGRLRNSSEVEYFASPVFPSVSVRFNTPYAKYVHNGTNPHIIFGTPLLVFRGADGTTIRTHAVHHPGYRGNPFLRNAMLIVLGRG